MIKNVTISHLPDLVECFNNSLLKDNYFTDPKSIKVFLKESIAKGELYGYFSDDKVVALMRIDPVGMFSKFPLLRTLAVNPDFRSKGIGKALLNYYEGVYSNKSRRIFICVSDFNPRAKKLYMGSGYSEVGVLPNLYKEGITEYLLSRSLDE